MGHALNRSSCRCGTDDHSLNCVYSQLFETPVPEHATRLRKYPVAPHPYILRPHTRDTNRPDLLIVDALLLGRAPAHSRAVLHALTEAAASGLGQNRARYTLNKLEDITPLLQPAIADQPASNNTTFKITFLSPHMVKHRGRIMDCERFNLTGWLTNLMRRSNSLRYFHGDGVEPTDALVQSMLDAFEQITLKQKDLHWQRTARHSSRQQKHIDQSGLLGQLIIDSGAATNSVLPLLLTGTYTHVGKSAIMGHGQYKIEPAT